MWIECIGAMFSTAFKAPLYWFLALYLFGSLALGIWGAKRQKDSADDYFLASRTLGPVVLFFTLIATNFSAFFFLGFSGMGYRVGYSYYGMMAFGTAFVALQFYFLGDRAWRLGRRFGVITPPELMGKLTRSRGVKYLVLAVMVVFTLPYLALQPMGAGILLERLSGGAIPYLWGAALLTCFLVFYVFWGGMRSVALTDVLQGILMFVLMFVAIGILASKLGGLGAANAKVAQLKPALFTMRGEGAYFTPKKWFSFLVLWTFCVPMFPHMFMRFFTPKSARSLQASAVMYPLVTAVLFLCPVMIGVLGHLVEPGLMGRASDQILPLMLERLAPVWVGALVMVGALAAFMSTMDSQLLALSSMLTRDVYLDWKEDTGLAKQVAIGRVFLVVLALVGLYIAYLRPATIFGIAKQAFTGLSVLFPMTIAVLYWRKTTALGCMASVLVGEGLVFASMMGWLPAGWSLGFLPVVPIVLVSALVLLFVSSLFPGKTVLWEPSEELETPGEQLESTAWKRASELVKSAGEKGRFVAADGPLEPTSARVGVIVPTYNHAGTLLEVLRGVRKYRDDVIVVDDGSTDETKLLLKEHAAVLGVEVVSFDRNQGKGAALLAGMRRGAALGWDVAIALDSDGQHNPDDLPTMLAKVRERPDALWVGSRHFGTNKNITWKSRFGRGFSNFWLRVIAGRPLPDSQSGFRAYPLAHILSLGCVTTRYEFEVEVLVRAAWAGVPLGSVPIRVYYPPKEERITHFRTITDFSRISVLNTFLFFRLLLPIPKRKATLRYEKQERLTWRARLHRFWMGEVVAAQQSHGELAMAVGFGVCMGIVPIWGYQMLVAVYLAHVFRLNKVVVLVASNISFGPMPVPITMASLWIGHFLLTGQATGAWDGDFSTWASIGAFAQSKLSAWLLGSMVLAVVAGVFFGLLAYMVLLLFRGPVHRIGIGKERGDETK